VSPNDEALLSLWGAGTIISVGRSASLEERGGVLELDRSTSITGGVEEGEMSLSWIDALSIVVTGSKSPPEKELACRSA
jgi:hypothetical protein